MFADVVEVVDVVDVQSRTNLKVSSVPNLTRVVTLTKLCRISNLGVNSVVQKHESQKRQNSGHENFCPISAEHDVSFVAHDFCRSERVANLEGVVVLDQKLFSPELEEASGVDGHRGREDENDEEDCFGLIL